MKKRYVVGSAIALMLVALFALAAFATQAESSKVYLSLDSNGQTRVTNVNEGQQVWICVYDPAQNTDTDTRDTITPNLNILKVFDPKTGAKINWSNWTNPTLEETGANTGLFVSTQSVQIGARFGTDAVDNTHIVGPNFNGGNYLYEDGNRTPESQTGRFSNNDTLVVMYQDPNDPKDVATSMAKINATPAKIAWDQTIYNNPRGAATITVTDPDENLNPNAVEYVPVFIIVNPGSWNPVQTESSMTGTVYSPTTFCSLIKTGGVNPQSRSNNILNNPIRWYNIYDSGLKNITLDGQSMPNGAYYVQYPVQTSSQTNVTYFDTTDPKGFCRVSFPATETGPNTGVFQLNLSGIQDALGFKSLNVGDVLVAYYQDPNDPSDFHIATAYIGNDSQISSTSFTDANRAPKSEYWLGRDPVYVQVIDSNANVDPSSRERVTVNVCDPHGDVDSEYVTANEITPNSGVFFTDAGIPLRPVWDALGGPVGTGGYQLDLNNWKIEAFNGDTVYARYNDVYYNTNTNPPKIDRVRLANDVSFAQMKVADTEVYNGSTTNMYFCDRNGNRITNHYVNSDSVFVEVVDPDQNEDPYRAERISAYWDGGQNEPFGPTNSGTGDSLLGTDNIFSTNTADTRKPKLYVLNPHNGKWAAVDLMETGPNTGDFVSVRSIDLVSQYSGVPTLDAQPGDTIIAVYQDPSNHSDSAWISIKVGHGGSGVLPGPQATITFADSTGAPVTKYYPGDDVYVKVVDPTHAGATQLVNAVTISGKTFNLKPLASASNNYTFITDAISMSDIGATAGSTITATYGSKSATAKVVTPVLSASGVYADPNPFSDTTTFSYEGSGIATKFSVSVYDLAGHLVWSKEADNVSAGVAAFTWDGTNTNGDNLVSGPYIYVAVLTGPGANGTGTKTFTFKGTIGIER